MEQTKAEPKKPEELRIVVIGWSDDLVTPLVDAITDPKTTGSTVQEVHGDGQKLTLINVVVKYKDPQDEVSKNLLRIIGQVAPGPHVFLLALKIAPLDTPHKEVLKMIQEMFGEESKAFMMGVFTYLNSQRDPGEKLIINDKHVTSIYGDFISDYHALNVEDVEEDEKSELLEKINNLVVKNDGKICSKKVLEQFQKALEECQQKGGTKESLLNQGYSQMGKYGPFAEALMKSFQEWVDKLLNIGKT